MTSSPPETQFTIRPATERDLPQVLAFIRELAEYERLAHEVEATETILRESLFGKRAGPEVVFGCIKDEPVGFAVFFHNFSTFLGRQGIYLEDLYVRPAFRRRGIGRALIVHLAQIAINRNCGRFEWAVLNWNKPAIEFYRRLGAVGLNEWTVFRVSGDALDRLAREGAKPTPESPSCLSDVVRKAMGRTGTKKRPLPPKSGPQR